MQLLQTPEPPPDCASAAQMNIGINWDLIKSQRGAPDRQGPLTIRAGPRTSNLIAVA